MNILEKIDFLMERDQIKSKLQLAQKAGIPYSTLTSMYNKGYKKAKLPTIEALCRVFNVTLDYLCDETVTDPSYGKAKQFPIGDPYHPTHKIPILGRVAAGLPLYAEENIEGYTYTELNGGAEYFALRVQGDSMNAAAIIDGDIIIVRRQDIVEENQIAVVLVDNQAATIKRFTRHGNVVTLMPQSYTPTHKPQMYDLSKTRIDVLGLVIEAKHRII